MQRIAGPGLGLPEPQTPYPNPLYNVPYTAGSNEVTLNAGCSLQVPAGDWVIDLGKYSMLLYRDPVQSPQNVTNLAGTWRAIRTQRGTFTLRSDGNNYRIANLLGCAVGAIIGDGGSGYTSAPAVTVSAGSSTWTAVLGGQIGPFSVVAVGSGYTVPPSIFIPAPNGPGEVATAYATLSGSTVASITITNPGSGYGTTIPPVLLLPDPFDVNLANISNASAVASLTNSGKVTGVLCTNFGAPVTALSATFTFTGGGGTSASATPIFLQTISSISVTTAGSSLNTAAVLSTMGGAAVTGTYSSQGGFLPRQANTQLSLTATGGIGSLKGGIVDGGMFLAAPTALVIGAGGAPFAAATVISLNMGSTQDTVLIQPM